MCSEVRFEKAFGSVDGAILLASEILIVISLQLDIELKLAWQRRERCDLQARFVAKETVAYCKQPSTLIALK
jgi:hypothetical protein